MALARFPWQDTGVGTGVEIGNFDIRKHLRVVGGISDVEANGTPVYCQTGKMVVSAGGAAGTHTLSWTIPAGSTLIDVIVHAVAVWNSGTSATLKVGDGTDDDGFLTGVNAKATDLVAGESLSMYAAGGKQGADWDDVAAAGSHIRRRYLSTARTVSAVLTLVGTAATTGETWFTVLYSKPTVAHMQTGTFVAT